MQTIVYFPDSQYSVMVGTFLFAVYNVQLAKEVSKEKVSFSSFQAEKNVA